MQILMRYFVNFYFSNALFCKSHMFLMRYFTHLNTPSFHIPFPQSKI